LDNLYTRALTGDCHNPCISSSQEDVERGSSQRRLSNSKKTRHAQINTPTLTSLDIPSNASTWGEQFIEKHSHESGNEEVDGFVVSHLSGCRLCARKLCGLSVKGFRNVLGSDDLAVAKTTLEQFDLVRRWN